MKRAPGSRMNFPPGRDVCTLILARSSHQTFTIDQLIITANLGADYVTKTALSSISEAVFQELLCAFVYRMCPKIHAVMVHQNLLVGLEVADQQLWLTFLSV